MKAVFIHESIFGYAHDWDTIADVLATYNVDTVAINDMRIFHIRPHDEISRAIAAFQSRGIKYHSVMLTIAQSKNNLDPASTAAILPDGTIYSEWQACPIKVRDDCLAYIQEYLTNHPTIDGLMLDYIRFVVSGVCYCPSCRTAFEAWLGEGTITDWTPFYPGGSRWRSDFVPFRMSTVTNLVRDINTFIRATNPNIQISAAVFPLFSSTGDYQKIWLGQDTETWLKEGLIDFAAPMEYTKDIYKTGAQSPINTLENYTDIQSIYWAGYPILAILRQNWPTTHLTPQELKDQVDYVMSRNHIGYMLWKYTGPGSAEPGPDYRDYLSVLDTAPPPYITPFTAELEKGDYIITMPTTLVDGADTYKFIKWEDGSTNPERTVNLIETKTITATYQLITTVIINGLVINAETMEPIVGATVKAGDYQTITLTDGTFSLSLPLGTYTVTISKTGYVSVEIPDVDATSDVTLPQPVQLAPSPPPIIPPWLPWAFGLSLFGIGLVYVSAREG